MVRLLLPMELSVPGAWFVTGSSNTVGRHLLPDVMHSCLLIIFTGPPPGPELLVLQGFPLFLLSLILLESLPIRSPYSLLNVSSTTAHSLTLAIGSVTLPDSAFVQSIKFKSRFFFYR